MPRSDWRANVAELVARLDAMDASLDALLADIADFKREMAEDAAAEAGDLDAEWAREQRRVRQ